MRTKPPAQPERFGIVRGLPGTYEVNEFGGTYGTQPANAWARGQIARSPAFASSWPPLLPMYDPTLLSNPPAPNVA